MAKYSTPEEYFFRLHHVRPRFKNDVERVLIFLSNELSNLPELKKDEFISRLNKSIELFPGNASKTEKTINNWRTEISALFGLVTFDPKTLHMTPGLTAKKLSQNQDLVEFFKNFLYSFQYPGGHLKAHETKKIIEAEIRFKPAKYILELLIEYEQFSKSRSYITKAEATHCIFNDLRATTGLNKIKDIILLIQENRNKSIAYDWSGDVIRYAGDILDYLVYANLLKKTGDKYYVNKAEMETIAAFITKNTWYPGYDAFYGKKFSPEDLKIPQNEWFDYVNYTAENTSFKTDILSLIGIEPKDKTSTKIVAPKEIIEMLERIKSIQGVKTKEIGDKGEGLIYGHECMRLKQGKKADLIKKVACIPNHFAIGYDIRSFELDPTSTHRLIEVKTSISNSSIEFNQFHLTDNEWNAAQTYKEKYYVYRLVINRQGMTLFIIRDPIDKYKKELISVALSNGAQIKFTNKSGNYEELLLWKN